MRLSIPTELGFFKFLFRIWIHIQFSLPISALPSRMLKVKETYVNALMSSKNICQMRINLLRGDLVPLSRTLIITTKNQMNIFDLNHHRISYTAETPFHHAKHKDVPITNATSYLHIRGKIHVLDSVSLTRHLSLLG